MNKPSLALKCEHDLVKMASTKQVICIKESDIDNKNLAKDFIKLLNKSWPMQVSRTALMIMREKKFYNQNKLPSPTDITTLKDILDHEIESFDYESVTYLQHKYLRNLLETKLVTYNRRRPLEIWTRIDHNHE